MSPIARLRAARLLWPTVLTALALPILVGLGTWQLQRKVWKEDLIAAIAARTRAAPASIDAVLAKPAANYLEREYSRVILKGHFRNGDERLLYGLDEDLGPGEHVYTPFETADGRWLVMVNRGFVPLDRRSPAARPQGQIEGETEVVGLVRAGQGKGLFEPANDPVHNRWFYRDIPAMAAGVPLSAGRQLAPFAVEVEAASTPPGGWPKGGVTLLNIPNRHLEYALTWYGLAGALLAVYGMFAAERLKAKGEVDPAAPSEG